MFIFIVCSCRLDQTLNLETEGASRRWPQRLDTSSQSWLANEYTAADEHECERFLHWNAYHQIDSRVDGEHWVSTVEGGTRIRYFFLIFPFADVIRDVAEVMCLSMNSSNLNLVPVQEYWLGLQTAKKLGRSLPTARFVTVPITIMNTYPAWKYPTSVLYREFLQNAEHTKIFNKSDNEWVDIIPSPLILHWFRGSRAADSIHFH